MSTLYNQLIDLGNDQKMIAATEVGAAPLPDLLQLYEAHWSWFCVWNAPFINDPEWNSPETLETVSYHANAQINYLLTKVNRSTTTTMSSLWMRFRAGWRSTLERDKVACLTAG